MVLTKSYLRYQPAGVFGVIASSNANILSYHDKSNIVVVPALESVYVWDIRLGRKVRIQRPISNGLVLTDRTVQFTLAFSLEHRFR